MKRPMKQVFWVFMLLCLHGFGQANLGKMYFRHPQYLLTFDKVLHTDKTLHLENVRFCQYLKGVKILDLKKEGYINMVGSDGIYSDEFNLIESKEGSVSIDLSIQLNEELNITSESYIVSYWPFSGEGDFQLTPIYSQSNVIKRFRNNEVQEVRIHNEINLETNELTTLEDSIVKRPLKSNEIGDVSGNIYTTVTIGDQVWMAENLRSDSFNDGTALMNLNAAQWANTPAAGIIDKNSEGYFYNFYTLTDDKNICPQGFMVPTEKDIARLYNEITPYDEQVKITMNGVKKRVYAPWLAPIVIPVSSIIHSTWWALESTAAGVAVAGAVATDLAYLLPWSAADLFILGPLTGWTTKNKYRKNAVAQAKFNSVFMDTLGYSLKLNKKGKWHQANFIPKDYWSEFTLAVINADSSLIELNSNEAKARMARNVGDADYRLTYNPFPTLDFKFRLTTFLFDEGSLYYERFMAITPYRKTQREDYPNQKFTSKTISIRSPYLPVLTLLLSGGAKQEFSNQFNFNLSNENTIQSFDYQIMKIGVETGISYDLYGGPAVWGIGKTKDHELFNVWRDSHKADPMKIATQVRCVSYIIK
jgi:hypothetical protein